MGCFYCVMPRYRNLVAAYWQINSFSRRFSFFCATDISSGCRLFSGRPHFCASATRPMCICVVMMFVIISRFRYRWRFIIFSIVRRAMSIACIASAFMWFTTETFSFRGMLFAVLMLSICWVSKNVRIIMSLYIAKCIPFRYNIPFTFLRVRASAFCTGIRKKYLAVAYMSASDASGIIKYIRGNMASGVLCDLNMHQHAYRLSCLSGAL